MKNFIILVMAIGILLLSGCSASDPNASSVPSETNIPDSSISATVSQTNPGSEPTEAVTIDAEPTETTPVSDRDEAEEAKRISQAPNSAEKNSKRETKPKETLSSQSSGIPNSNVSKKPSESNPKQNTTPSETTAPQTEPPRKKPEEKQEEPKPTTQEPEETQPTFDINYWVEYAKKYAQSVGLNLNPDAVECWDNPTTANSRCIYLERDLSGILRRYSKDSDITDVWIWHENLGKGEYLIYIGYA